MQIVHQGMIVHGDVKMPQVAGAMPDQPQRITQDDINLVMKTLDDYRTNNDNYAMCVFAFIRMALWCTTLPTPGLNQAHRSNMLEACKKIQGALMAASESAPEPQSRLSAPDVYRAVVNEEEVVF